MPSLLRDRNEFVIGAAVLGTGLGVLNLAHTSDWGWILALIMLPALIVRAVWQSMPGWLLLSWVTVPTLVGDAAAVTQSAYLVVIVALAVVAACRMRPLDIIVVIAVLASPFLIWALQTNEWHGGLGSWIWFAGLLIGLGFGHVAGQQLALIDELERTRTKLAETAVAEDRQRIARDLHDLVGHSFSVVLLHLSGARMILDSSPEEAAEALRQAEAVGRKGMDELRQALLLMHQGDHSLAPIGNGDLDRLVDGYRDAGMRVEMEVTGDVDEMEAAPRLVLHDVLREALTNVAKHAHSPEAAIRIGIHRDGVAVRVESALAPDAPPPGTGLGLTGLGLTGLEQRVTAIDGTFQAWPDRDRWVVQVDLPCRLAGVSS